jgi:hypothetical protein
MNKCREKTSEIFEKRKKGRMERGFPFRGPTMFIEFSINYTKPFHLDIHPVSVYFAAVIEFKKCVICSRPYGRVW